LQKLGVTPNQVSVVGFLVSAIAALLLMLDMPWAGLGMWFLGRLADSLDGTLARANDASSSFGGYLDILLDMAAYSLMILGFAHLHPHLQPVWQFVLVAYVLVITSVLALASLLSTRPNDDNRSLKFTPGLTEATETSIAYSSFVLLPQAVAWLSWLWFAMVMFTVLERTLLAKKLLQNNDISA
jgi:phosphatidylglycerophosphate synthase